MPTSDPNQDLSDHDLLAGACAGERVAVDRLFGAVRRAVHAYARGRLCTYDGGAQLAEEVTQEVCLALVDVLPRYEQGTAPFVALVYAIAKNKIVDAQRRYARSPVQAVDELPDQPEPAAGPEQQVIARSDIEVVLALLQRLPARTAHVVWLRAQGLSANDVGALTGLSANAVRVTQHRGVAAVRQGVAGSAELRERFEDRRSLGATGA